MGQIDILGRIPLEVDVSPWWEDTFYEQGTRALTDLMDLVQKVIRETSYHIDQAQVEVNLAKRTAEILASSSTRSAQDAYTCVAISGTLSATYTPPPTLHWFPALSSCPKAGHETTGTSRGSPSRGFP
ncbi:hypothetical protein SKAU_G00364030 [Synaphobranchus kaupii]|uniref:Uncharacterized protein n=1 Tax=Synaphobranchus kaupii TaxID=118154 RepID=A0A9Q1IH56_SYNKA|nr:hypothetical protein SKAU_G00364030 [Synaphobranchus kaupii]